MKRSVMFTAMAMVVAAITVSLSVAEEPAKKDAKVDLSTVKCPISGKAVKAKSCVEHNGGKVYLCCDNCVKAWSKKSESLAAKANHQLVQTKQAKLVKCPYSGGKLNPKTKISIAGVNVCFCCNECKAKTVKADAKDQMEMVFGTKGFKKGFNVTAKE